MRLVHFVIMPYIMIPQLQPRGDLDWYTVTHCCIVQVRYYSTRTLLFWEKNFSVFFFFF
jgi:hypothetical protein